MRSKKAYILLGFACAIGMGVLTIDLLARRPLDPAVRSRLESLLASKRP